MENNMAVKDDKTKRVFEDRFSNNYYKDMPRIDAGRLIYLLLNPGGVIELPISGFVNSPNGEEKRTFSGYNYQ